MTSGVRPLPPLPRSGWPKRLPCLLCDRPRLTYSPNDRRSDRCRKSIEGVDETALYATGTTLDHTPVDLPTSAADSRSWKEQAAARKASHASLGGGKKRGRFTPEVIEKVRALYRQGKTQPEIARVFGVHVAYLWLRCSRGRPRIKRAKAA